MSYVFKLETFEGPLDLLIKLIGKSKIDIINISISEIADQYFEYIKSMNEMDIDITIDFLLMASTLLKIKSEKLLPKEPDQKENEPEDDINLESDLKEKLILYKKYKDVSAILASDYVNQKSLYRNYPLTRYKHYKTLKIQNLAVDKLLKAYSRLFPKSETHTISFKQIKVEEKINIINKLISFGKRISFFNLIKVNKAKNEILAFFLALLELAKNSKVILFQKENFGDIYIEHNAEGEKIGRK